MDKAALRDLAEKATPGPHHIYTDPRDDNNNLANSAFHDACWPQTILSLLDEIQSLTEERTAWRTTAENAEAELKAIKEAEPVAWEVYVAEADHGYLVDSLDDPQLIDDCTNHDAVVTPLYTLEWKS